MKIQITEQWIHGYTGMIETPKVKSFKISDALQAENFYNMKLEEQKESGGFMSLKIQILEDHK